MTSTIVDHAEDLTGGLLERAFGLGWAAADYAHLPALPEALTQVLGVAAVHLAIVRWDGTPLMEHAFPPAEQRIRRSPMLVYEVEENLGAEYAFHVTIETDTELSATQTLTLNRAVRLIRQALDCILVRQRDRSALGEPFAYLSEKEWQICTALERPDGEKQIAASLDCSRHTVHGYVTRLYRKLQVKSRLQMLEQLKNSRDQLRRRTLAGFAAPEAVRPPTKLQAKS